MTAYNYINTNGTVIVDTALIQAEVTAEYQQAFGADINLDESTPQGVLYSAEVQSRIGIARNNAKLANQINPNLAGGVWLDAILALTGTQRTAATFSFVSCDLTGQPLAAIPAGVTASTSSGFIFESETAIVLDSFGNGSVIFRSVIPGEVAANAGTLNTIENGVIGWETVNNTDDATLGSSTQSDEEARIFRSQTLASYGTSQAFSITSALQQISGVRSLSFLENISSVDQVIEGIPMVGHSIWACVDGGTDEDIGTALVSKKSAGAAYNGSVSVAITEPTSGQPFDVLFERPTEVDIVAQVTISSNTAVSNPEAAIKEAILAYANGQVNGEEGFVVGADVSPFELAGAITCLYPGIYVKTLEVSKVFPLNFVTTTIDIDIDEVARIVASSITIIQV